MNKKNKKEKSHVRDTWIPQSWRYNGGGYQKSVKYTLPRKAKHKKPICEE